MNAISIPRRRFLEATILDGAFWWAAPALVQRAMAASSEHSAHAPKCSRIPGAKLRLGGQVLDYLTGVPELWLKVAPLSNPAMLEMFRDRDRRPLREMVPWAGSSQANTFCAFPTCRVQDGRTPCNR